MKCIKQDKLGDSRGWFILVFIHFLSTISLAFQNNLFQDKSLSSVAESYHAELNLSCQCVEKLNHKPRIFCIQPYNSSSLNLGAYAAATPQWLKIASNIVFCSHCWF